MSLDFPSNFPVLHMFIIYIFEDLYKIVSKNEIPHYRVERLELSMYEYNAYLLTPSEINECAKKC